MSVGIDRAFWLTGLSGAGKSTIAAALNARLRSLGERPVLLDGDAVRLAISDPGIGHDRASRLANAYRMSRLAKLFADQGHPVIVATMSLFHEVQAFNREHLRGYFEVLVEVEFEELRRRDARGLYSRAARGEVHDVVGIDVECEFPVSPDLVIRNGTPRVSPERLAERILCAVNAADSRIGLA